jgi:tetratricopeptide (TPR) repeat protein
MKEQHSKFQDSIGLIEDFEDSENVIDEEIIRKELDGLKVRRISNDQKNTSDLKTKLTESKISHTLVDQRSNKVLVRKVSIWLAAASIAVLMVVTSISLVTGKGGSDDLMALYEQNFSAPIPDLNVRGINPEIKEIYQMALEEYDQKNYEEAYALFNKIPEGSPPKIEYYLYKGVTEMELGDFNAALRSFENLLSNPREKHAGMWYMGLSHIANDNIPAARQKLEKIIATDGYYKKDAKKLLRKI